MTVIGSVYEANGTGTVRMEDVFDTDIDDLWSAITEPDRLARWLVTIAGEAKGTMTVHFRSDWDGTVTVKLCEPPHRLVVESTEQSGGPTTEMEAVLTAEGSKTRLVIEDRGLPLEDAPYHGAGWQVHIEDLESYIEGREVEEWRPRWEAGLPAYLDKPLV